MKFGEKYELLESLTTGAVETFMANDKVRGERVLVHILDCAAQKPNQPTVQWVLDAFRAAAPEPVGLVLETGRYSGTLYGYLISELPEEVALKDWVRRYNDHARDTQESPSPVKPAEMSPVPPAKVASQEPVSTPVQFTQVFRNFESQTKAKAPAPEKEIEPPSARPLPSLGVAGDPSGLHAAPSWDEAIQPISPSPKRQEHNLGSPASSYRDFGAMKPVPETMNPAAKEGPKLGEFTSFFQGPFRPDGPSEMPVVSSREMEPPRKSVGDFTAMFGSVASQGGSTPAPESPRSDIPASGFTGLFNGMESPSRTFSGAPLPGGPPPVASDIAPPLPVPRPEPPPAPLPPLYVAPTPPVFPAVPPSFAKPATPVSRASSSGGATRAFSTTGNEPAPGPPPAPSGPSAYTQIISVKSNPVVDAPGAPPKPPAGSTAPAFTMPPLPSTPPPMPPPLHMPQPPPMPKLAFSPPPAPKLPTVEVPKPISWWPLILTLTVLFFIAVLLVLYYMLKH
jgi:hypothetical protein